MPTYQIIEQIRKEEKRIARKKLGLEKGKTKAAREATKTEREQKPKEQRAEKKSMINFLLEKDISVERIAKILDMTPKAVEKTISNQSAGT